MSDYYCILVEAKTWAALPDIDRIENAFGFSVRRSNSMISAGANNFTPQRSEKFPAVAIPIWKRKEEQFTCDNRDHFGRIALTSLLPDTAIGILEGAGWQGLRPDDVVEIYVGEAITQTHRAAA